MTKRLRPQRLSARDAARFVLGKLSRDDAQELYFGLREGEARPSLTADERAAFVAMLEKTGIDAAMYDLGYAMKFGAPEKADAPGRVGRPARVWLRRELRALRATLARSVDPADTRHLSRVMALLLVVYGFDRHGVWWTKSAARQHPPKGAARLRWLVKRIVDLCGDGAGQYAARTVKRPPGGT